MFFENLKIVTITLLNSKSPFNSFIFPVRSIQISSSKKIMFTSSLKLFLKLNVIKIY